ncbi:MAG TPA: serine/threonine-protein kinase [Sandaracinaceae bacterium LLY-WYZ-13_1]|nr:serine/threonine-protein kinase [Sandaracinaceae bacterium LLY-WYZ-13_1]
MLRKLEKYEIEEEIGHGGMATVYRAHDTVLDRQVALKVMHPHLRGAEEARRRFQREARSVARLRHPRVLEIYDFSGEGSAESYIAAELLTGPTLKQWREKHQDVPAEVAACFVIEIARALEAAHEAGVVHRDVKPENVLLHEDRTLKLTDFGIAELVDAQSMTATGQILGSPGHMAPEQIEGKDTDERTDLFSLGTVLYYLATGRLPFTGRNPHQVLKRIVDGEYADPLRVNPTIGGRLRAIIERSLAKDPDERYQSAAELREALEGFVAEAGIEDPARTLESYLQDPEGVRDEVVASVVGHLIGHGVRASDAGDVPTALDYYNRVLALDEGNEKVLKLIEQVGMDRRRRTMMRLGAGLIAFGVLAGGGAWALWPDGTDADPTGASTVGPIAGAARDAGIGGADAGALAEATPDAGRGEDAGEALASATPDAGAAESQEQESQESASDETPRRGGGRVARSRRPREVTLASIFRNMGVRVLDARGREVAPLRPLSRRSRLELPPGRYTFVLEPGPESQAAHYATTRRQVVIRPGADAQTVSLRPELEPAPLQVNTGNVVARVVVGRGRVVGRSGNLILVPMRSAQETLRIEVTAEGYEPVTATRTFEAGGNTVGLTLDLSEAVAAGPR